MLLPANAKARAWVEEPVHGGAAAEREGKAEMQERGDPQRRFRIVCSDSHEHADAPGQVGFLSRIHRPLPKGFCFRRLQERS